MRHALEPDHLAAVTTLVSRERNFARAALMGVWWGLGHTLSLVLAGAVLVGLRAEMPAAASDGFEFAVALMLVGLGVRAIAQAARLGAHGPTRIHRHGRVVHSHAGVPAHVHIGAWTLARRPLLVGAIHGLAGSGALTALVLATLPVHCCAAGVRRALWSGFDSQHGGVIGAAWLAARALRDPPCGGTVRVAARRLSDDHARSRVGVFGDRPSLVRWESRETQGPQRPCVTSLRALR